MSTMRNSVILIGRPGAEPETRTFNDNRIITRFSLAVNETHRNAKHEQVKDTQWFNVVAWDKTAERVALAVKKGRRIAIDGALRNNVWTDKEGNRHTSTEIHLNNFVLLDWGKEQNN
ncbi:MAG: single-stranded DNA-binding protein [Bacteroidales bacterium]|nr:single-stranded DNA-binding protein [Bacteroidales bacterium]